MYLSAWIGAQHISFWKRRNQGPGGLPRRSLTQAGQSARVGEPHGGHPAAVVGLPSTATRTDANREEWPLTCLADIRHSGNCRRGSEAESEAAAIPRVTSPLKSKRYALIPTSFSPPVRFAHSFWRRPLVT